MQFIVVCTWILLTGAVDPESAIVDPLNTADGVTVSLDDPRGLNVVDEINNQWQMVGSTTNLLYDWMLQINLAAETYGFEAGSSESTVTVSVDGSRVSEEADLFVGIGIGNQYVTYAFDIDGSFNIGDGRKGVFMYPYCSTRVMMTGDVSTLLEQSNLDMSLSLKNAGRLAMCGGDHSNCELLTGTSNADGMPFTIEFVSNDVEETLQISFWTPTYASAPFVCEWDVSGTDVLQQDIDIFVSTHNNQDEDIRISSVQVDAANVGAGAETCWDIFDDLLSTSELTDILAMQSDIYTLSSGQSVRCSFVDMGDSTILVSTLFLSGSLANMKEDQPLENCGGLLNDCVFNEDDVSVGESASQYRWSKASIVDYRALSLQQSIDGVAYLFLTCNQNVAMDVDFMLLPFDEDFLTTEFGHGCYEITKADIRGYECENDVGNFWQGAGIHFHIDSSHCRCGGCCAWNEGAYNTEDSFGLYYSFNPDFTCASSDAATTDYWISVIVDKPLTPAPTTVCDESAVATFDWGELMTSGTAKPEVVVVDMSVDETDLSLNIEVQLTFEGRSSADNQGAVFGTTYVLDFEDFDAHTDSIAQPGTCQNRNAEDFAGAFDTFWEYPLNPIDIGSASYLAYPPPNAVNGEWSVAADSADECGVVVYTGKFGWNDLVSCRNYDLTTSYITTTDDDVTGKLSLQGTFYVNVVSPYAAAAATDTGYYRVYQLLSQPFIISVNKNLQVLGKAGINLFTISVIAVYKEDSASIFKLIVLTESAEYLQLAGTGVVAFDDGTDSPVLDAFTVADTAENDGCLNNKALICSQLWEIQSPGDCDGDDQYIDFSGEYTLQFTPVCRTAADVGSDLATYCSDWLDAHTSVAAGVGLTATLLWRDEECDPLLFEVQFQAEMLFYVDDAFTVLAESDTLYQVGEDRIFVEVDTAFPSDTYDVFDTQLLNVWICTFDPLNGPTLPIEAGELSGGCFSTNIDGYNGAENYEDGNMYAYHIFAAQSTVSVADVIDFALVGHPTALDVDNDKVRFSFVVPPQIARDTLYIHAQIEVSLTGARRRRQLLTSVASANQIEHFLGNVGVSETAQPKRPAAPQQPDSYAPVNHVPGVDNNVFMLSLQSPWVLAIAGLLVVILTCNIVFMGYMRCCGRHGGSERVSFGGRSKRHYKAVKVNESEVDDSEAHAMNVASE